MVSASHVPPPSTPGPRDRATACARAARTAAPSACPRCRPARRWPTPRPSWCAPRRGSDRDRCTRSTAVESHSPTASSSSSIRAEPVVDHRQLRPVVGPDVAALGIARDGRRCGRRRRTAARSAARPPTARPRTSPSTARVCRTARAGRTRRRTASTDRASGCAAVSRSHCVAAGHRPRPGEVASRRGTTSGCGRRRARSSAHGRRAGARRTIRRRLRAAPARRSTTGRATSSTGRPRGRARSPSRRSRCGSSRRRSRTGAGGR